MGIADIREAFLSGADGYLDVRDVGMRYAKERLVDVSDQVRQ